MSVLCFLPENNRSKCIIWSNHFLTMIQKSSKKLWKSDKLYYFLFINNNWYMGYGTFKAHIKHQDHENNLHDRENSGLKKCWKSFLYTHYSDVFRLCLITTNLNYINSASLNKKLEYKIKKSKTPYSWI